MAALTALQREVFNKVRAATRDGSWYRAHGSGERVTLASLWRRHFLDRRIWRGEGTDYPAHEYRRRADTVG